MENVDLYLEMCIGCKKIFLNMWITHFLNRNVITGILGFRYETKNEMFIIYSPVEAKTFCMIMQLNPIPK